MMTLLAEVRTAAFWLAGALLVAFIGANVRHLAAAKGWDNFLTRGWDHIAAWLPKTAAVAWREKWWFWLTLGFSAGIAIALWMIAIAQPLIMQPLSSQAEIEKKPDIPTSPGTSIGSSTFALNDTDIKRLRDAVANIRGILPDHINFSTADDAEARLVANVLSKGFRLAGVNTDGMSIGTPLNSSERGVSIRVSPGNPPTAALAARNAIEQVMRIPPAITPDAKIGTGGFEIFVGTNPNEK